MNVMQMKPWMVWMVRSLTGEKSVSLWPVTVVPRISMIHAVVGVTEVGVTAVDVIEITDAHHNVVEEVEVAHVHHNEDKEAIQNLHHVSINALHRNLQRGILTRPEGAALAARNEA